MIPEHMSADYAMRLFVVTSDGVCVEGRLSHQVDAALDMLTDDGMPADSALPLLLATEANGDDPEAFARHLLRLRRAAR